MKRFHSWITSVQGNDHAKLELNGAKIKKISHWLLNNMSPKSIESDALKNINTPSTLKYRKTAWSTKWSKKANFTSIDYVVINN